MNKILVLFSLVMLFACVNNEKTKVTDLRYEVDDSTIYVFQGDVPFDGQAWSEYGKKYRIIVDCGIFKKAEFFDNEGKLFSVTEDMAKDFKFYNEKGVEIPEIQATVLYEEKWENSISDWMDLSDIIDSLSK